VWLLIVLLGIIALVLVGWAVIGLTLKLLGLVITGVIVGALARLVLPGSQPLGWLRTILYGIGGALIGALLATVFDFGWFLEFLLAIGAAAVLISVFSAAAPRRV
jgi:uncharacterized membrane protein YeaQ/YmgE (transglycosylase-associated protein family)